MVVLTDKILLLHIPLLQYQLQHQLLSSLMLVLNQHQLQSWFKHQHQNQRKKNQNQSQLQ